MLTKSITKGVCGGEKLPRLLTIQINSCLLTFIRAYAGKIVISYSPFSSPHAENIYKAMQTLNLSEFNPHMCAFLKLSRM
jgi:hypothetical protein